MKTAVVTGGSKGIGREICRVLASNGYKVISTYNNTIPEEISNVTYVKCDLSKDVNFFWNECEKLSEKIDLLVNNAGVSMTKLIQDYTNDDWEYVINTNLKSAFFLSSLASEHMIKNKSGNIINISSMWGETGASCESLYSITKAGLINLTKSLAKELAPSGIRVNSVSPGVIHTDMLNIYSEDDLNQLKEETPIGRLGTPKDIADTILFLASEKASFITGQNISVDGGFTL